MSVYPIAKSLPTQALIRSVLIAGVQAADNPITRYCENHMLKVEHISDWSPRKPMPSHCDAAIIAVTAAAHETTWRVREIYAGKPIYWSKNGVSSFREEFEQDVFGDGILRKLRNFEDIINPDGSLTRNKHALSISARAVWLMARFMEKGSTFTVKEFAEQLEKLIGKKELRGPVQSMLQNYAGVEFESAGNSKWRFWGIPDHLWEILQKHAMPLEVDWKYTGRRRIVQKSPVVEVPPIETPLPLTEEIPEEKPEEILNPLIKLNEDTRGTLDLLLESMAKQQEQISALSLIMDTKIPLLIQKEIRGITQLLGSLVPKLQGLTPEEVQKVDQMLDLFLGMRK